jgi:hypothetical protein
MLLISVGTGASANANSNLSPEEMNLLYNAGTIPSALLAAALHEHSVDHIGEMQEVGQTLAQQKVKAEHFAGFPAAS